jgi:hypothetical protein
MNRRLNFDDVFRVSTQLSMQGMVQGKIGVLVPAPPLPGPPPPPDPYNCSSYAHGDGSPSERAACNSNRDCWFAEVGGGIFLCLDCPGRGYCPVFGRNQTCSEDQACKWNGTACSWLGPDKDPSCQPPP